MRILTTITLLALLSISPDVARADGLIYKLPEDGTSVEFEMKGSFDRDGQTMEIEGTLSMSSVGSETVDGETCRWVEFKMVMKLQGNERKIRAKVLVPVKQLAAGKSPISHVKKAWIKMQDRDPKEITDFSRPDAGPLPAFLAGPFDDAQKLEAQTVEGELGKLNCKGLTGSTRIKESSREVKYTFTNRLNDKAPFGVVTSEIMMEMTQNGQQFGTGTMTFKVIKVGKNAVSEIPNGL